MAAVTSAVREPLITGGKTVKDVSHDISRHVENNPPRLWYLAMAISLALFAYGFYCVCTVLWEGIGVWGLNKTVGWAWDITNFVWWVGIGHAGTLISAILLLFRQRWRMSINRAAEAMT
ncbi:MAG TPA: hydrogenase, partial [Chryseosolibacter sp.]|nr:hydrogenase [Chryseosolibacter sp.]